MRSVRKFYSATITAAMKRSLHLTIRNIITTKLVINSQSQADTPLIFKNIAGNTTNYKNTAPREAEEIIEFIKDNPDKSIGCDHTV